MSVLIEDPSSPEMEGKQEHVVAVGGGPIRHRHPSPLARDQSAQSNQQERCRSRKPGKPIQPDMFLGTSHHQLKGRRNLHRSGPSQPTRNSALLRWSLEGELSRLSLVSHGHFLRLLPGFPMIRLNDVFARGHIAILNVPSLALTQK